MNSSAPVTAQSRAKQVTRPRAKRLALLLLSHSLAVAAGIAVGIYTLPILIAPDGPSDADLASLAASAVYRGQFRRDLDDSDWFHWGEGAVSVGRQAVSLVGRIAPGPDYKLYLAPEFVETERDFYRVKPRSAQVGDVNTFTNFVVRVPDSVDVSQYNTVVIWCETFSQFITSASYRD